MSIEINTIVLHNGRGEVTAKGDTIWGADSEPREVKRWHISEEAAAKAELAKHKCEYWATSGVVGRIVMGDEWALEYCECDEDGEWDQGSDFWLADETNVLVVLDGTPDDDDPEMSASDLFGVEYVVRWVPVDGVIDWYEPSSVVRADTGEDVTAKCIVRHAW